MADDGRSIVVTPEAAQAIREIVVSRAFTPESGLRISRTHLPPGSLLLSVVSAPHAGDLVAAHQDVPLFIEPSVKESVAGRCMDVEVNPQGVAFFFLTTEASTVSHRSGSGGRASGD